MNNLVENVKVLSTTSCHFLLAKSHVSHPISLPQSIYFILGHILVDNPRFS